MKSIFETAPTRLNDMPEEIRTAFEELRAGRNAPEGTFYLRTQRSRMDLQKDYYVAQFATIVIFAVALCFGGYLLMKVSAVSGAIVIAMFGFCGVLSQWLWAGSAGEYGYLGENELLAFADSLQARLSELKDSKKNGESRKF